MSFISCFGFSQSDLLLTDFQTGMPLSYTIVDNDGQIPATQVAEYTDAWITILDPDNSLDTIAASTSYFSPSGTASRWLITPSLTLGTYGNFLEWEAKSQDASVPDDYLVLVSTTDALLTSFTDTVGYVIEENFEWTNRTVNLSSYGYDNQIIYVAFVNVTNDGFKLYIDDIHVWENDPVGINEITASEQVTIFPNPSNGEINISTDLTVESVSLITLNGQIVLTSSSKKLDLTTFPSGVYFLNIQTNKGIVVKKILKY